MATTKSSKKAAKKERTDPADPKSRDAVSKKKERTDPADPKSRTALKKKK